MKEEILIRKKKMSRLKEKRNNCKNYNIKDMKEKLRRHFKAEREDFYCIEENIKDKRLVPKSTKKDNKLQGLKNTKLLKKRQYKGYKEQIQFSGLLLYYT